MIPKTAAEWSRQIAANLAMDSAHIPAIMSSLPVKEIQLETLQWVLDLCDSRQLPIYNKDYKAGVSDVRLFVEAAMERVKAGEPMNSTCTVCDG